MNEELNKTSLDTICSSLAYAIGIDPPAAAEKPNEALISMIDSSLPGKKADRIFMFNPDAIPQWILQKYPLLFKGLGDNPDFLPVPLRTVMPSVTPVCFGTMYTGAQPSVHGIQKYEKPVIKLDSIFDALIRAGKKPIILATTNCSMSKIFLERDMDYFIGKNINEVKAEAKMQAKETINKVLNDNIHDSDYFTDNIINNKLNEIQADSLRNYIEAIPDESSHKLKLLKRTKNK